MYTFPLAVAFVEGTFVAIWVAGKILGCGVAAANTAAVAVADDTVMICRIARDAELRGKRIVVTTSGKHAIFFSIAHVDVADVCAEIAWISLSLPHAVDDGAGRPRDQRYERNHRRQRERKMQESTHDRGPAIWLPRLKSSERVFLPMQPVDEMDQ